MKRVCLISPAHLSSNPRLVKAADAIAAAGWEVSVVSGRHHPPLDKLDDLITARRTWKRLCVDYRPHVNRGVWLAHHAARLWLRFHPGTALPLVALAQHRAHFQLVRAARSTGASLFIGHNIAGLAAAARAATASRSLFAFDAEDFHPAETDRAQNVLAERIAIQRLEEAYLPRAAFATAASPLIAEQYTTTRGISKPHVLLNVFPLSDAPLGPLSRSRSIGTRRLYWFSQTVGPGRGLEEFLDVLVLLRTPCSLHLRGTPTDGYQDRLVRYARQRGFRGAFEFLPRAPADEMVRLCQGYDAGLSLELTHPLNRDLCLTNKIFTYILAGVPVICSPTRAHRDFAQERNKSFVYLLTGEERSTIAAALDQWLGSPTTLSAAAHTAWEAGRCRYNWDVESRPLIELVTRVIGPP